MNGWVVCAATPTSGIRHRFAMLSAVKAFADAHSYAVALLWGATRGVADCRFEELLAPVPGVLVQNVFEPHLKEVERISREHKRIRLGNREFQIFRPDGKPSGNVFSWDLKSSGALGRLSSPRWKLLVAKPSAAISAQTDAFARRHGLSKRIGIRVRVEEVAWRERKPHRIKHELDQALRSIIRIPWYAPVFVVTDSEYIQQTLASHFADCLFFPKTFDLEQSTGRYVHRQDKDAMVTFLKEVDCLCRCAKIINIGGFLNDNSVRPKWLNEPYGETALAHLRRG